MATFNPEDHFPELLFKIQNGQIKTTHQMRIALEALSEEFNIKPLLILELFREWLLQKNITLSTTDGMVTIEEQSSGK